MVSQTKSVVEGLYPQMLETISELTRFDRGSRFVPGLRQTAAYLTRLMEGLGCTVEIRDDDVCGPTVIARKKGLGKGRVLIFAHMDTVWPEGSAAKRPLVIEGNLAYGAGVSDDTPGMIAQIYTLKTLNELGFDQYDELIIMFNPDEEISNPSSGKWIQELARTVDFTICNEGPEHDGEYVSSRHGSIYFELAVEGRSAHAGGHLHQGRNAIVELCNKVLLISNMDIPGAEFNVSFIEGGEGFCTVAGHAKAILRYSVLTMEIKESIAATIENAIRYNRLILDTTTTLTRVANMGMPPYTKLEAANKLWQLVEDTSEEVFGYRIKETTSPGTDDAGWSTMVGTPTLDGLSPISNRWHREDEYLHLDTLVPRITLAAEVIMRACQDDSFRRV